jgi:hypothetical protein
MWWLPQTSGYSYPRVVAIRINVHTAGENVTNTTRMLPTPVCICPAYASCGRSLYVATFRETLTDLDWSHCSREKGLLSQSTARRLTDLQVHTQLLCRASQWSTGRKPSSCRWPTTRFTRPISPACDRTFNTYSQVSTHWSLTDICGGYNLGGAGFPHTTPWRSQPVVSPFPSRPHPVLDYPHNIYQLN